MSCNAMSSYDLLLPNLLEQVRRMARGLARRLPSSMELDDLIAAGNLGVTTALTHFAGHFEAVDGYALALARGAMLDELRRLDTMSRLDRRNARRARAAIGALRSELCRMADEADVAEAMGMEMGAGRQRRSQRTYVTVEAAAGGDHPDSGKVVVPDERAPMEQRSDEPRTLRCMAPQLAGLPPHYATVIALSFEQEQLRETIGKARGASATRAGQLRRLALEKLRRTYSADDGPPNPFT